MHSKILKHKALFIIPLLYSISGSVYAADGSNNIKPSSNWKGTNAGIGFIMTTGDTKNSTFNSNLNINYNPNKTWTFLSKDTFQRSASRNDGLTAWSLVLTGQADYNFSPRSYIYSSVNYTNNKFDGYDYRLKESIGYGRNIKMPENMKLSVQFGPGAEQSKQENIANSPTKNRVTANLNTSYVWNFTEKSNFTEDVNTVASKETVLTEYNTALTTNIYNNLDLQLNYKVVHSTNPVDGKKHFNTTLSVNMLYNFA